METPLMLRIEKARNELRFAVNKVSAGYGLPGYLVDLVVESVLAEERQQRISLMSEQITLEEVDLDGGRSEAARGDQ